LFPRDHALTYDGGGGYRAAEHYSSFLSRRDCAPRAARISPGGFLAMLVANRFPFWVCCRRRRAVNSRRSRRARACELYVAGKSGETVRETRSGGPRGFPRLGSVKASPGDFLFCSSSRFGRAARTVDLERDASLRPAASPRAIISAAAA